MAAFFTLSRTRPLTLLSVTDLAVENERLEAECGQLQRAVTSHATIDQAIGVVMVLGRFPPEEAWRVLRDLSQRTNTKLSTIAQHILAFAQGGDLPPPERSELRRALSRHRDAREVLRPSGRECSEPRGGDAERRGVVPAEPGSAGGR
ncbi:ANTAR domain-containing protein [Streptomyces sp. NPDC006654]|uniref:ANTAR domain-containing protein n=1 Tax=unclassified Streptomyces TaxID=2593676 RepID=UPI0033C95645